MVKTRTVLTALFASLAAALVGGQFLAVDLAQSGNHPTAAPSRDGNESDDAPDTPNVTLPGPTNPATSAPDASATPGFRDGTVTGQSVSTPYGDVQVKVSVRSGSIADVVAVRLTDRGSESVQISNYAAPILRSEVLQSQSAKVSSVSGATYTSFGYLNSLQSALDQLAK